MISVLYVLPELTSVAVTAAQVRALALLPIISKTTKLSIITFRKYDDSILEPLGLSDDNITIIAQPKISNTLLLIHTFSRLPRAFCRYDSPHTRMVLETVIQQQSPDVIHFDGFATLGLLEFAKTKCPKAKIVAHMHDAQSLRLEKYIETGHWLRRFERWLEYRKALTFEKVFLTNADLCLVDSDEDREYLRITNHLLNVSTLPLGFDRRRFSPLGSKADLRRYAVVYSGSMRADQSVDAALFLAREVMPLVWKRLPEVHLYIVGSSPTRDVVSLEGSHVHVTGFVEDMAIYLRSCDVYACPLRLGSGMRTRVVEALACGAKVVATPMAIRGLKIKDGDEVWKISDHSPHAFSEAVLSAIQDDESALGRNAANYVDEHFSWEKIAVLLLNFYKKLSLQ